MTARADSPDSDSPGLRANRDFHLVLSGQAISALGDAITLTALPLLVLSLTGSGALMGVVGAVQILPDLLLGLPAGALADRLDRRLLMMWADAGRAVLTGTIPLSIWFEWQTMTVILVVAIPINALRVLSDAGLSSAVPGLVGRKHLGRANSVMEATLSVPFIVGPAVAGVLLVTIGPATTIAIDAASFALSVGLLALVRRRLLAERSAGLPHFLVDMQQGIGFVWNHRALRTIIAYWCAMAVATAALIPALGYYVIIDRKMGPELFGFIGSAWSVGYLIGSVLSGRFSDASLGSRMLGSGFVVGGCLAAFAIAGSPLLYCTIGLVTGFAVAIQTVSYMTLRPSLTPDVLLGRVGSTSRTIAGAVRPLGLLGGGALIEVAGGGAALLTMGILASVASVLFGFSKVLRSAGMAIR